MNTPLITVFGATGAQGGGLARALLQDPQRRFRVRAITRQPGSAAAQALSELGAEIIQADLDEPASVQRAMQGAYGTFCVTNYWEHLSPERELRQAGHLAQAAADAGLRHVVWSTLEDTRAYLPPNGDRMPILQGRYNVPHMDIKGQAERMFSERGLPTSFVYTSFYWDNLIHFGMGPQRGADGRLVFVLPMDDKPLPGIAAEDIGACVAGLFLQGEGAIGRHIGLAGEHLSGTQMAAALGRALGQPVQHLAMPPLQYAQLGFPGAEDLANMFQFKRDFNLSYCGNRDVEAARALHPGLLSFEAWLARHAARIPLPAPLAA